MVNKQLDPENDQFLVETNLPTPMTARVYVNLLEGILFDNICLVVSNMAVIFQLIYGRINPSHWWTHIFQDGSNHQPDIIFKC